jgi:hypothetical protein
MLNRVLNALLAHTIRWHDAHIAPYRGLMIDIDAWRAQRNPTKPS